MFTLTFDTDNAAFYNPEGDVRAYEVARILRDVATRLDEWDGWTKFQAVRDSNGNRIGQWKLNPEEER